MKRTNIMLSEEQHKALKKYARKEGRTIGELVRTSLDARYKEKNLIEHRRQIALDAYKEGFISIGKLSEITGLDLTSLRLYLKEQNIRFRAQTKEEIAQDAINA